MEMQDNRQIDLKNPKQLVLIPQIRHDMTEVVSVSTEVQEAQVSP